MRNKAIYLQYSTRSEIGGGGGPWMAGASAASGAGAVSAGGPALSCVLLVIMDDIHVGGAAGRGDVERVQQCTITVVRRSAALAGALCRDTLLLMSILRGPLCTAITSVPGLGTF